MRSSTILAVAALGVGVVTATSIPASAQSDRTLGINCTVAGHIRCGENRPIGARWHRGFRAYGAAHCTVVSRHVWRDGRPVMIRSRRCY